MSYGLVGKFIAHPGKKKDLIAILLEAANLLQENKDCLQYLIGENDEKETVIVSEIWTTQQAHDASLEPENIRALIKNAMPLIASMSQSAQFAILGGKGI